MLKLAFFRLALLVTAVVIVLAEGFLPDFGPSNWQVLYGGGAIISRHLTADEILGQGIPTNHVRGGRPMPIDYLGVRFACYGQKPSGRIEFRVLDGDLPPQSQSELERRTLRLTTVDAGPLKDNQWFRFNFKDILPHHNNGFFFTLKFSPRGEAKPLGLYLDKYPGFTGGSGYWLTPGQSGRFTVLEAKGHFQMSYGRSPGPRPILPRLYARWHGFKAVGFCFLLMGLVWSLAPLFRPATDMRVLSRLSRFIQAEERNLVLALAGLVLILAGSAAFKYYLSPTPLPDPIRIPEEFSKIPIDYKLFWPTGFVLSAWLQRLLGGELYWQLLTMTLVISTFVLTRLLSKSLTFDLTTTLAVSFLPFTFVFTMDSNVAFVLMLVYLIWNLICLVLYLRSSQKEWLWFILYLVTLLLIVFNWPAWLNHFIFLEVFGAFLLLWFRGRGEIGRFKRTMLAITVTLVIGAAYVAVYSTTSFNQYHFQPGGHEDETVFTYSSILPMLEDIISNLITYVYFAVTYFVPWQLLGAWSPVYLPPGAVENLSDYVGSPGHNVHLALWWRYLAGTVSCWCLYRFFKTALVSLKDSKSAAARNLLLFGILLVIIVGSATHIAIKYRQIGYVVGLTYKFSFGVLAACFLVGYLVQRLGEWLEQPAARIQCTLVAWGLIVLTGLSRPYFEMILLYTAKTRAIWIPDPMRNLLTQFFG